MNPKSTLFSILVANYNNGKFFMDCYHSIIKQTYTHWEVVIVDDGSTDDSVASIKDIIKGDSRFRFYNNDTNRGVGYTKHKCAELASGDILGFLDPDDALYAHALEVMVNAHQIDEKVVLVSSKHDNYDINFNFIKKGKHGCTIPSTKSYLTFGQGAITAFATFKRSAYLKTVGIDVTLKRAIDQDLYFKLEEQGPHLFINDYLYLYRRYGGSISQNNNVYKADYWRFVALNNAYKRRKQLQLNIDNYSPNAFKRLQSNYYIARLKRACNQKNYSVKYYFLIKSIYAYPMHKIKYKLKALLFYKYA